jgi:hypothetical protein
MKELFLFSNVKIIEDYQDTRKGVYPNIVTGYSAVYILLV